MKFQREPYSDGLVEEMWPLWRKHWEEIAVYKDILLDPDLEAYMVLNAAGKLRIFTARQNGSLTGYQIIFLYPQLHYRQSLRADQDILFMSPEMRRGLNGYRFIQWCDSELTKEGVHVVFQHVKVKHDHRKVLERMGYELHDLIFCRRLN